MAFEKLGKFREGSMTTYPTGARHLESWEKFEEWKEPQDSRDVSYTPHGVYDNTIPFDVGKKKRHGMKIGRPKTSGKETYSSQTFVGERCYHKHPALKLPGSDKVIYGGSCSHPIVKDADVYIGFTESMRFTERHWPWKKGNEVMFYIPDMGIPAKPEEFKKLVSWTVKQIEAGLKVHCGCMGGHGRTGTFLAAVCATMGEPDAINYVRKNYCLKAVEATAQVDFLAKEFGVTKVVGHKANPEYTGKSVVPWNGDDDGCVPRSEGVIDTYGPMASPGCIWGP